MGLNPYKAEIIRDPADLRLFEVAKPIKDIQCNETFHLIDRLKFLCIREKAAGLAATQIGINKAAFVFYNDLSGQFEDFINPKIVEAEETNENMWWAEEGCLSAQGLTAEIARPRNIVIRAQRLNEPHSRAYRMAGMISRICQHEIDHLNGILFSDKGKYFRNPQFEPEGMQKQLLESGVRMREGQKDWTA